MDHRQDRRGWESVLYRMVGRGALWTEDDYLGNPDMNMAWIAKGFGVEAEVAASPAQLKEALGRARKATVEGKPYLIDAQVARAGVAWADKPWTPPIRIAQERSRKV